MRTILILCLSILFLPLTLAAEGLTVTGGEEGTDYSYAENVYTVLTETALTFSGTTTTDRIVIEEGVTANVTINGLSIDISSIDYAAAIQLKKQAKLILSLSGTNEVKSGRDKAGIHLEENSYLKITAENTSHSLKATGGNNPDSRGKTGSGIGGCRNDSYEATIEIENGKIEAIGGNGTNNHMGYKGAGIGSDNLKIIFKGGEVIAKKGNGDYRAKEIEDIHGIITVHSGTFDPCSFGGETSVDDGTFTNCTFNNVTINGGTFTNCPISGDKAIINKGTINNTDGSRITSDEIIINGGNIKITIPQRENGIGIHSIETKKLIIYGGNIFIEGQSFRNANGGYDSKGGNAINATESVEIYGGTIYLLGGSGNPVGGYADPGLAINSPKIIIGGGSLYAKCGSPWTVFPFDKSIIKNQNNNDIYLGITPEIANATDVSVDGVPYYISGNHPEGDNKLYLYMTGVKHTITVRTNDNKVTTYPATYVPGGVDGDGNSKGYFTFDAGSTTTPSDNSAITFEAKDITTTYNKENNELKVKLTVTEKVTTRSAAMNSVQLTLTDGTNTYYSDRQTVTGSDEYTFTFDTQGLDAGNYTLTANYGGSATSLTADEQTKTLTIEKATPIYIIPSGLSVTYGKTLADINLPDGWAWNASETSVGNVSSSPKTFAATFTPADTKNYNTVVENLSITVNKAEASNPKDPEVTSSSPVTYGAKLSDITITDDWQWEDGTIVPTVTNSGYMAYYPVTDYDNYDWSKINDYDEANHRVRRSVSVTVNKADLSAADFTFTAPTDLVYNGNKKAATIKANDGLMGVGNITLKYYKESETAPVDPTEVGTYTVKIDVAEGDNYNSANDLNVPEWTFTILPKQYAIAIDPAIANGTVTADKTQAIEGETVTLTVTPAQGYEQETLSYTTDGGTTETITGTTFVMPAADVTVTATFKASSVPPVNPPVIPDDPDDPAPVRYTVTLPTVEGAATDPAAGSYEVESWGNFSFLLTLGEGYRKDSHPVVTARGETLTPNASTGKYIIPNVQSDITVGITGIVKDVATGNESLSDGFHITTSGGLLLVTVPRATRLYLTDTSGRLILSRLLPAGDTRIDDLAAGVYLLTLEGEKTKKIIIR
ncbi:hypothetical protein HMPREF1212_02832 [Parabacteroides sp. HGS0025]|uniref:InlB B-repeat-containing protein n=1 Tax=Parabacteroides sp. HGS0025 TaxID=1078087 RepID=UPI0006170CD4|nr:hypothetical protein [Parabacteroides sp. HGS0025]KKB49673.1 hypothetical protein HMPREF1212_02832 [Parabacteroides sp. HGS0025]